MLFHRHAYKHASEAKLMRSGANYFNRLLELIDSAKYSIHLQVYIFDLDTTGQTVLSKLIQATQRGVAVYLVVDGYASPHFTRTILKSIRNDGIWVKQFAPLHYKSFTIGRRLHHKVVLVDDSVALVGGINIADKYSGYSGIIPWLDVAIEVQGPVCADIKIICEAIWPKRLRRKWTNQSSSFDGLTKYLVCVAQNDWWRRKIEISQTYRDMIRHSQSELTLMASYFLPGLRKRLLLKQAAERGVNITIILGGHSDIPLMKPALQYIYSTLSKHNITVYEWTRSVLHGKMAVADEQLTTVGSYNLNSLSDYGSLELNINVNSPEVALQSKHFLQRIIAEGCTRIDADQYAYHPYSILHVYRLVCYQLLRFSLFVLFVLMHRDRMSRKHF